MLVRRATVGNGYPNRNPGVHRLAMIVTPWLDDVLRRLSLDCGMAADLKRLRLLYGAWCSRVPFDNVRKMIALRTGASALPGIDPADFYNSWLVHGTGSTCWPGSNALHALIEAEGFAVRRATGSMRDVGVENHGTLIVRVDDRDWLVDSSMLLGEPVELRDATYQRDDRFGTEVEVIGGSHVVWYEVPPHTNGFPCRLLRRDVDEAVFRERYDDTRNGGPFNDRLYARRNTRVGTVVIRGTTRFERDAAGAVHESVLDRDGILDALVTGIGISREMTEAWVECGALEATMVPYTGPAPQPLAMVRPSRRGGRNDNDNSTR